MIMRGARARRPASLGQVVLLDVDPLQVRATLTGHTNGVNDVAFSRHERAGSDALIVQPPMAFLIHHRRVLVEGIGE